METSMEFEPDVRSAAAARRFIRDVLNECEVLDEEVHEVTLLLVSELVTNAVVHASSPAFVSIEVKGEAVRTSVADRDPRHPQRAERTADAGGFGLWLLDELAEEWGVERHERGTGKTIWFRVPVSMGSPTAADERQLSAQ